VEHGSGFTKSLLNDRSKYASMYGMTRNKAFTPNVCLAKAAEVFATHGYAGTSMAMLTDALGIGRQSLYDTFGDKQALLLAAIENAAQNAPGRAALTRAGQSGRAAIEAFFAVTGNECADSSHPGCLVSNLLLEQGQSDPLIAKAARSQWQKTRNALKRLCERNVQRKCWQMR
jgi:TetR/AcrR family transcriptional regulator, transcriptional repressor for nem operon